MNGLETKPKEKMEKLLRVGCLVNHAKMIKKESNLAGEMTQVKEKNKDVEKLCGM